MSYLSYCGILCDECPVFIATKNNDQQLKENLALEYSNDNVIFQVEDMYCEGCFSQNNDSSKMCGDCEIRNCAKVKKTENCGKCSGYPCEIVERRLPKDFEGRLRLDQISK